jgi:hypothetical protein
MFCLNFVCVLIEVLAYGVRHLCVLIFSSIYIVIFNHLFHEVRLNVVHEWTLYSEHLFKSLLLYRCTKRMDLWFCSVYRLVFRDALFNWATTAYVYILSSLLFISHVIDGNCRIVVIERA